MDKTVTLSTAQRLAIAVMLNRVGTVEGGGRTIDVKTARIRKRLRKCFEVVEADESIEEILADELERIDEEVEWSEPMAPTLARELIQMGVDATVIGRLLKPSIDPVQAHKARQLEREFAVDDDDLRWLKVEMEQHDPLLQWADDHLDAIDQIDQAFATKLEPVEAVEASG